MKELYLKLAEMKIEILKNKFDNPTAYKEFFESKEHNDALLNGVSGEEIESLFPAPIEGVEEYPELNESGDPLTIQEFSLSPDERKLSNINHFGWLDDSEIRNELINNKFYRDYVRKSLGDIPDKVKDSIELHALHILGRCNNPRNWETETVSLNESIPENWLTDKDDSDEIVVEDSVNHYWRNKQGLVFGMVQSGKTASMISLVGLAKTAGYRLFIILSGDKTSLRDQTQKRVKEAFDLNSMGMSKRNNGVRSLTNIQDYGAVRDANGSALNLWNDGIIEGDTIVICIKKESSNLNKLIKDLGELKQASASGMINNFDYENDLKTLIIDDEADFGSQNTSKTAIASPLHQKIVDLREALHQNTYVAYTATPQACLGANPQALVGYPSDFIWLLDPYRDEKGLTTSYLGLEEFFSLYESQLIKRLPNTSWPFWMKSQGVRKGVYRDDGTVDDSRLEVAEIEAVQKFIDDDEEFEHHCMEYMDAIAMYIVTCSLRWYRHYVKCQAMEHFIDELPSKKQIRGLETGEFKEFPYHAIMFNLSRLTGVQSKIRELVEKLFDRLKEEFAVSVESGWTSEGRIERIYRGQLDKSNHFSRKIPDISELGYFMKIAIEISADSIPGEGRYIYLLNSQDEGQTLRYGDANVLNKPKKAGIIVGGNILARGLTIENLSISVFARSQVMSLGDTNLQMCRWFGHKKQDADLHAVFMQNHSKELFASITQADRELRDQFWYHISINTPTKCILLEMQNNPLFRVTSPSKSLFLERSDNPSYSGRTVDCLEPMLHQDYLNNNQLLDDYLSGLNVRKEYMHKRACVYNAVNPDEFLAFFSSMHIHEDADFVNPNKFVKYMAEWKKDRGNIPVINVAVFGVNEHGQNKLRERARLTSDASIPSKKLGSLRGGKSQEKFLGDAFVDKSELFHEQNYSKRFLKRSQIDGILVIFYKLNHNYISKDLPKLKAGEDGFEETPLITFAVSSPLGGPKYSVYINRGVRIRRKEIAAQCDEFFESVNMNSDE